MSENTDKQAQHEKHSRDFTTDELLRGGEAIIYLTSAASGDDMRTVLGVTITMAAARRIGAWGCVAQVEYDNFKRLRDTVELELLAFPENVNQEGMAHFRTAYDKYMPVLEEILG